MVTRVDLADLEAIELDGVEPSLKSVGYSLETEQMRPNVWLYEAGETNSLHNHAQQEELYYLIDGRVTIEVDETDWTLSPGEFLAVPPASWRRVSADDRSTLLVVGAPNAAGDETIAEKKPGE